MEKFSNSRRPCDLCGGWDDRGLGDGRCWGYRDGDKVYCTNEQANRTYEKVPNGDTYRHWFGAGECKCGVHHNMSSQPNNQKPKSKVVDFKPDVEENHWDYLDEIGNLITRVIRYRTSTGDKTYKQFHPDKDGKMVPGRGPIQHLLYRLPEILALPPGQAIASVEGEKSADACWDNGIPATCNIGGAGKWHEDYNHWLKGHPIVIIPDRDKPGLDHANLVAEQLAPYCKTKKLDPLPDVGDKGDPHDFFVVLKKTKEDFLAFTKKFEWVMPEKLFYWMNELDLLPDIKFLLENIFVQETLGMVLGESGVGKTYVALHLGLRIASETGKLVIYNGMEALAQYKERIKAWINFYNLWEEILPNFLLSGFQVNLMDPASVEIYIKSIKEIGRSPAILWIDTYHAATEGAEENSAKDTGIILSNMRKIRNAFKCTVIVLHHLNATGLRERGSSALKAGLDTVITLKTDNDGIKMECAKQRTAQPFETRFINWVYTDNPNRADGPKSRVVQESTKGTNVDLKRPSPNDKKVLQILGSKLNVAGGLRFSEIQDALPEMAKSSINGSLKKIVKAGWAQGGDRLPYKITNEGLEIIGFEAGDISDY
jgi:hypothetical protein